MVLAILWVVRVGLLVAMIALFVVLARLGTKSKP